MFQRDFQVHSAVKNGSMWEVEASCIDGFIGLTRKHFIIIFSHGKYIQKETMQTICDYHPIIQQVSNMIAIESKRTTHEYC